MRGGDTAVIRASSSRSDASSFSLPPLRARGSENEWKREREGESVVRIGIDRASAHRREHILARIVTRSRVLAMTRSAGHLRLDTLVFAFNSTIGSRSLRRASPVPISTRRKLCEIPNLRAPLSFDVAFTRRYEYKCVHFLFTIDIYSFGFSATRRTFSLPIALPPRKKKSEQIVSASRRSYEGRCARGERQKST